MSARVRVKKVVIGEDEDGLQDLFNQMLGSGSADMKIAYPRYERLRELATKTVKLINMFAASEFFTVNAKDVVWSDAKAELVMYCEDATRDIDEQFGIDFSAYVMDYSVLPDQVREEFLRRYESIKTSEMVNKWILILDKLAPYKKQLSKPEPSPAFILNMPGVDFCPFVFARGLNIKQMLSMDLPPSMTRYIMALLQKIFQSTREIYSEITTPDIDIDQFVHIIVANIDKLKKIPELSRCGKAIDKLKQSVQLLKSNFGDYYKDFVVAKDQSVIMQRFVIDVSQKTSADTDVAAQFIRIIRFYQRQASSVKDPRIKKLLDNLSDKLSFMSRGSDNLFGSTEDAKEASDDSEPVPAAAAAPEPTPDSRSIDELVADIESVGARAAPTKKSGRKTHS